MDSFFKQRFNAGKCKTMLKLSIPRIKLLRNRREVQIKQMRKEIAKLLEIGQEATARIRVEHIIREEKMMAAQEIVELFCELIAVRLPIIETQRECPLDLKEAISSVCFAAPRCADLPELLQVQILFSGKYGKEFVAAATELMPECGVNRQLVELLSVRAPAPDVKLKLLKEIAEEHGLDWDHSATENELLKKHEDLLNGPTQFTSGYKLPLPKEKHEDTKYTSPSGPPPVNQHSEEDDDYDMVEFPDVPTMPLIANKGKISAPEMLPFPDSALSDDDNEETNPTAVDHVFVEKPVAREEKDPSTKAVENPSVEKLPQNASSSIAANSRYQSVDLQDVLAAAQAAAETAERAAAAARSAASIAQLRISELVQKKNDDHQSAVPPPQYDDMQAEYSPLPSPAPAKNVVSPGADQHHQPQRLPSMDDESFFSYPNLFSSQGSNLSSRT